MLPTIVSCFFDLRKDVQEIKTQNGDEIKKKFKDLSKDPKANYHELLSLYQKIVVYYYYLKKTDGNI